MGARLRQWWEGGPLFARTTSVDAAADATAAELAHLHDTSIKGTNLRRAIERHLGEVWKLERDLLGAVDDETRARLEARLRALVAPRAPYTAMVRSALHPSHAHLTAG